MANQEFVITQTSIQFQNDLNKIERMLEIRGLGVGLDYLVSTGIVSARTTTEATPVTDPPFEIADDGGNIILRIDNDGYLYTKEFDGSDYARRSAIYQIGTGLQLISGTLSLTDAYSGLAKIYTIGQGLNLTNGELKVIDDLFNLAKIYNIGQGLQLNSGTLNADVKDVTVDGTSVVNGRIAAIVMPVHVDSGDGAWEVADESGNVVLRVTNNGHLITQQFNSEDFTQDLHIQSIGVGLVYTQATRVLSALIYPNDTTEGAYEIADENGNVALRITNEGHLLTSQFDSEEVGRLVRIYSLGTGLVLSSAGELSASITGGVTDVKVDNISVVTNTVANITMPVSINEGSGAFEIADQDGNVALQITSEGHLKTKEFDSSNINILPETVNDRYLHTNATTGELEWSEVQTEENEDFKVVQTLPPADITSPKVVYNLLDSSLYILDLGGAASSLVGVGLVGYMLVG